MTQEHGDSPALWRRWRFTGMPAPAALDVYARARESVAAYFRRVPGAVAVYEFGHVEYPGLSDLDVLVVLEDDARRRFGAPYGTEPFSPSVHQVVIHPPQFVPRSLWARMPLLWNIGGLERLWGEELLPGRQDWPPRPRPLEFLKAVDLLVTSMPMDLLRAPLQRRLNARMAQTKLKVLALYAGKLADLTGRPVEGARRFADDVAELRRGWFDRPPEATHEMLGELIGRVGGLIQAMAAPLGEALSQEFGEELNELGAAALVRSRGGARVEVRFEPGRDAGQCRTTPEGVIVSYPVSLAAPLRVAAGGGGPLAQALQGRFEGAPLPPAQGLMHESNRARNEHCRFLLHAGIPDSKTHYFGFTSPDNRGRLERAWGRTVNAGRTLLRRWRLPGRLV